MTDQANAAADGYLALLLFVEGTPSVGYGCEVVAAQQPVAVQ